MDIPGFKGVIIEKCEQQQERIALQISMPKRALSCQSCGRNKQGSKDQTSKID